MRLSAPDCSVCFVCCLSCGCCQTSGQTFLRIAHGILKRWPAVKNIHRRPGTCNSEPPHGGIQGREGKQPSLKSQAFISVNHSLCKTLPLAWSWTYLRFQSGSFWPYKENKRGIWAGLAKVGQTQTFLAYYQHKAFVVGLLLLSHHAQSSTCFPFFFGVSKQAGAIKEGCGEDADKASVSGLKGHQAHSWIVQDDTAWWWWSNLYTDTGHTGFWQDYTGERETPHCEDRYVCLFFVCAFVYCILDGCSLCRRGKHEKKRAKSGKASRWLLFSH